MSLRIIKSVEANEEKNFMVQNGVLHKIEQGDLLLVVPKAMQKEIILQAQGHFGWRNIEYLIRREYWFPVMRSKIQQVIGSCIHYLLAEKKRGKAEGLLHPLHKEDTTWHVPCWSSETNPINEEELQPYICSDRCLRSRNSFGCILPNQQQQMKWAVELRKQVTVFGNLRRIITDCGTAFISDAFQKFCEEESIEHILTTTGVLRGNDQVERLNQSIITILTKLSLDKPKKWYKHVDKVQQFINSSFNRSIDLSIRGAYKKKNAIKNYSQLRNIIQKTVIKIFQQERLEICNEAKESILKIQKENRKIENDLREDKKQQINIERKTL